MVLNDIKLYLRVDGDEEDVLISNLQLSSEVYLKNAGIEKDYTNELYKLATLLLISHWFENRNVEHTGKTTSEVNFSLKHILTQLKYCQSGATI